MIQIKKLNIEDPNFKDQLNQLIFFEAEDNIQIEKTVAEILSDVKKRGDQAVIEYTKKFDHVDFSRMEEFEISKEELNLALENLPKVSKEALEEAAKRVFDYHKKQLINSWSYTEDDQTLLGQKVTSLDRVGLYVPGGKAAYPSSVLMNAIPAIVAGVKRVVMINPGFKGKQNPAVLYAARKCKIKEIYSIGGPSAIAAVAYGTKKINKVNKIVGPGNEYVAAAKKEVFGDVGIEGMTAGPSEVTIVCDKFSNPEWVASDLIGQAEHDNLAQCILISKDKPLIEKVKIEISKQLKEIPRQSVAKKSLMSNGILMHIGSDKRIIEVVNKIAPEHLELNVKNYKSFIPKIKNYII